MEPIDKWESGYKEYFASVDPATGIDQATGTYINIMNYDYESLYPGVFKIYKPDSETEEKIPTLNESRIKEIKP
jgi:hypothetical protein